MATSYDIDELYEKTLELAKERKKKEMELVIQSDKYSIVLDNYLQYEQFEDCKNLLDDMVINHEEIIKRRIPNIIKMINHGDPDPQYYKVITMHSVKVLQFSDIYNFSCFMYYTVLSKQDIFQLLWNNNKQLIDAIVSNDEYNLFKLSVRRYNEYQRENYLMRHSCTIFLDFLIDNAKIMISLNIDMTNINVWMNGFMEFLEKDSQKWFGRIYSKTEYDLLHNKLCKIKDL